MNDNNLQRRIIIPPVVFNKSKDIIIEDQKLSQLDNSMKNIIRNIWIKLICFDSNWYQYRENLLKFLFAKKSHVKFNQDQFHQKKLYKQAYPNFMLINKQVSWILKVCKRMMITNTYYIMKIKITKCICINIKVTFVLINRWENKLLIKLHKM